MNTKAYTQQSISFAVLIFLAALLANCSPSTSYDGGSYEPVVEAIRVESQPAEPGFSDVDLEQGSGSFSMATANTERPTNVVQKVEFFNRGGGGRCNGTESRPTMVYGDSIYEIVPKSRTQIGTETIFFISCGWVSTGKLPVVITNPDGSKDSYTAYVQEDDFSGTGLFADFEVKLGSSPTLGNYKIEFKGKSGTAQQSFTLTVPTGPRLHRLDNGDVVLWNFVPYETISLFAYEYTSGGNNDAGDFVAYKQYQADADGNLYVDVSGSFDVLMALGEFSGEVEQYNGYTITENGFTIK